MGQVAFDTQEFVETLENAGLPKDQARAISIAVRKSHEVADVATKTDLAEVNRNISDVRKDVSIEMNTGFDKVEARFEKVDNQIVSVRKDMAAQFEKTDAQIVEVRKDLSSEIANIRKDIDFRFEKSEARMQARFDKNEAQMHSRFEKSDAQIALLRKDVESTSTWLLIKMGSLMLAIVGSATAFMKFF